MATAPPACAGVGRRVARRRAPKTKINDLLLVFHRVDFQSLSLNLSD